MKTKFFKVIKWRRIEWEKHVQRVGRRGVYKFWWGNLRERVHLNFKNRVSYIRRDQVKVGLRLERPYSQR